MLPPPSISEPEPDTIVCDAGALRADLTTIELLARLRLTALALGRGLVLRDASRELAQLIAFCGLAEVLQCAPPPDPSARPTGCGQSR